MEIKHVLSDGTVLESVAGCVVKADKNSTVYALINNMNERRRANDEKQAQE